MSASITIRRLDPGDKSWLQRQAQQEGVSMEEFMRQLIRDIRTKREGHLQPSKIFALYFGEANGVELPKSARFGYRPVTFLDES